jgi:hypothetical protein
MLGFRSVRESAFQGCQMVCFQTKNANLGKFFRALQWKMLVNFMDNWSILRLFGTSYGILSGNLVYFPNFGMLYQEKSGIPVIPIVLQTNLSDAFKKLLRAILNFTPGPQGRVSPLGVNLAPSFTPRGEHSLLFRRMEG